jgi:hypothetical protein
MLISDSYRALNLHLHALDPDYGISARHHVARVRALVRGLGAASVLDYGCGKGLLREALGPMVAEYDPAVPGKDTAPRPADLLCAIEVLEHVEPDCLADVLAHMRTLARDAAYLTIATGPARKTLPDGRNTHLIVRPAEWWLPRLFDHGFRLAGFDRGDGGFITVME